MEIKDTIINDKPSFVEKEITIKYLKAISSKSYDIKRIDLLDKILQIVERYQEKPTLLDSSLNELINIIMKRVREILEEHEKLYSIQKDESPSFAIQRYENPQLNVLFTILYSFMKVRGYKTIIKFLPHEAADLEPVIRLFLSLDQDAIQLWKSRYCLFVWLSILVIIPFDLTTVDSTLQTTDGEGALIPTIISTCEKYILKHEATRDVAAICIAKLLTRYI